MIDVIQLVPKATLIYMSNTEVAFRKLDNTITVTRVRRQLGYRYEVSIKGPNIVLSGKTSKRHFNYVQDYLLKLGDHRNVNHT